MAPAELVTAQAPADPYEAAAIAAAIQRFEQDTAPVVVAEQKESPWLRAALVEGVSAKAAFGPGDPLR